MRNIYRLFIALAFYSVLGFSAKDSCFELNFADKSLDYSCLKDRDGNVLDHLGSFKVGDVVSAWAHIPSIFNIAELILGGESSLRKYFAYKIVQIHHDGKVKLHRYQNGKAFKTKDVLLSWENLMPMKCYKEISFDYHNTYEPNDDPVFTCGDLVRSHVFGGSETVTGYVQWMTLDNKFGGIYSLNLALDYPVVKDRVSGRVEQQGDAREKSFINNKSNTLLKKAMYSTEVSNACVKVGDSVIRRGQEHFVRFLTDSHLCTHRLKNWDSDRCVWKPKKEFSLFF